MSVTVSPAILASIAVARPTGPPPTTTTSTEPLTTSCFSARSSTGMRKPISRIALSTVNAIAVTHAVWMSGSAMPSTATST